LNFCHLSAKTHHFGAKGGKIFFFGTIQHDSARFSTIQHELVSFAHLHARHAPSGYFFGQALSGDIERYRLHRKRTFNHSMARPEARPARA
jgi:hypothetical protein